LSDESVLLTVGANTQGAVDGLKQVADASNLVAGASSKVGVQFQQVTAAATSMSQAHKSAASAVGSHTKANGELSSSLKEIAGGFTLLDGPLGGVASRFRALGSLSRLIGPEVAAVILGITSVVFALKDGLQNSEEYELANVKLSASLEATGRTSVGTSQLMFDYAKQLSDTTLVTREQALSSEALLATFKNIPTDKFDQIIKGAQGLAELTGRDMSSVVIALGKALEDPTKSLDALRRMGIQFTESQKEMMKTLQAQGDLMDAQVPIYQRLNAAEKVAEAEHDTLAGSIHDLSEKWKEFTITLADDTGISEFAKTTASNLAMLFGTMGHGVTEIVVGFDEFASGVAETQAELLQFANLFPNLAARLTGYSADLDDTVKSTEGLREKGMSLTDSLSQVAKSALEASTQMSGWLSSGTEEESATDTLIASTEKSTDTINKHTAALMLTLKYKNMSAAVAEDEAAKSDAQKTKVTGLTAAQLLYAGSTDSVVQGLWKEIAGRDALTKALNDNETALKKAEDATAKVAAANAYAKETKNINDQITALQKKIAIEQTEAEGGKKVDGEIEAALEKQATLKGINYTKEGEYIALLQKEAPILKQIADLNKVQEDTKKTDNKDAELQKKITEQQAILSGQNKYVGDAAVAYSELTDAKTKDAEAQLALNAAAEHGTEAQLSSAVAMKNATAALVISDQQKLTDEITIGQQAEAIQRQTELTKGLESAAEGAFSAFLKGGQTTKQIMYQMVTALEELLVKMAIFDPLAKSFEAAMNGSSIFSFLGIGGSATKSAQGNVFSGGGVTAFASGGIVDGATAFPMSSGTGLMGEAGPEAIIPLTRTAGGDLGIRGVGSMGGQSVNMPVSVVVNHTSGGGAGGTDPDQARKMGDMIADAVSQNVYAVLRRETGAGGLLQRRS